MSVSRRQGPDKVSLLLFLPCISSSCSSSTYISFSPCSSYSPRLVLLLLLLMFLIFVFHLPHLFILLSLIIFLLLLLLNIYIERSLFLFLHPLCGFHTHRTIVPCSREHSSSCCRSKTRLIFRIIPCLFLNWGYTGSMYKYTRERQRLA